MNACAAGHFNVPVVLVSGDNILEEEVKEVNTAIETVVVKTSYGRYTAKCLTPSAAFEKIKEKVKAALLNIKNIEPNIVSYSGKSIIDIYRALTAMIKIANSN